MKKSILIIACVITSITSFSQLVINQGIIPVNGVQNVLLGTGVSISNVTYTGSANALGSFTTGANSPNIGLSNGLILSTGIASEASGDPYSVATDDNAAGSDPQLAAIATEQVFDAAVLEFDFYPLSDTIQLRYVFASEEYPEYVGQTFNDVFGFFISGTNPMDAQNPYLNKNIALIPGTTLPVTINNVNGNAHSQFYVDNFTPLNQYVSYDGMTTVLTAIVAVVPCQSYHIKIAIGDVGDGFYDSSVFLEANSFSSIGGVFSSGIVSGDTAICSGSNAPGLTLVNNIWPIVRWESSVFPYETWTPIVNTATTYYPGILTQTTVFHAVVQSPCSEESSMFATILVDSMPIPQFSYTTSGLNVEFINESTNATSYVWNFGSETSTSVELNPTYEYPLPGQYNVGLMAYNGQCEANYSQMIILTSEKIDELNAKSLFVYPNPTNGKISIKFENENSSSIYFCVVDNMGKVVYEKSIAMIDGMIEMDLSTLSSGIYIVRVANDQEINQFKIVIE